MRSYRDESGTVKKEVLVHLGAYETPVAAVASWPEIINAHRSRGRYEQADKLEAKLRKLQGLVF